MRQLLLNGLIATTLAIASFEMLPATSTPQVNSPTAESNEASKEYATPTDAMSVVDLNERAKKLREEIDSVYEKVKSDGTARYNDPRGTDISKTVLKYVPVGISFHDAEIILRFAGFNVLPSPVPEANVIQPQREDIVAVIKPFEHGFLWSYYSSIWVTLTQRVPGDYGHVGSVSAKILFPES